MKLQSRLNRDVTRQNKATSVVKATMLSKQCDESILGISDIISNLKNLVKTSNESSTYDQLFCKLEEVLSITKNTNSKASRLYMRCSTYIKLGASEIAHNENAVMKRAVKFEEYDDIESEMDHYDPWMLSNYKVLSKIDSTSSPTSSSSTTSSTVVRDLSRRSSLRTERGAGLGSR